MTPSKKLYSLAAVVSIIAALIVGCSVVKTDNNDKEILDFVTQFKNDLKSPSQKLVSQYFSNTTQSRETLIEALEVLKNNDSLVQCAPHFESSSIVRYSSRIQVTVPVTLSSVSAGESITKETELVLFLQHPNDKFVIVELDGTKFYQAYTAVKNERVWAAERKIEFEKRKPIYALADSLGEKYDSVIWYAQHQDELYFYAVSGSWNNYFIKEGEVAAQDYKMGLINSRGDTLIPIEYDLIGTLAFSAPSLVEVKKDNKYGYFHLDSGKLVVEPVYDMIIPYDKEEGVWAMALSDTVFGWIDADFQYQQGYPSDKAMNFVQNFEYLKDKIVLKAGNQTFCEIPAREYAGFGIIMPPSFYVKNNLFTAIVGGINTTQVPMNGWTDYIEAKNSFVNRIGDNIRALISVLQERYIGGREEFYGSSQVTFVNENEEVLATTEMPTDQEIVFRHVDEYTIELVASSAPDYHYYAPGGEHDIPVYKYFRMDEGALTEVESKRLFPFTEFVKIDSSYLEGPFSIIAPEPEPVEEEVVQSEEETGEETTETEESETQEDSYEEEYPEEYEEPVYDPIYFFTLPTLEYMRDEILASNGYQPLNSVNTSDLHRKGFTTGNGAFGGDTSGFSEIDKHNYEFLSRVISLIQSAANEEESGV
jgi:hypothetical protein